MLTSPAHALELLGGAKAVSDRTGRPFTTVASWASRQSIPLDSWPCLIDMAAEKSVVGFSYEALAKAHVAAEKPSRGPKVE